MEPRRRHRLRATALAGALAFVPIIAACGGDESGGEVEVTDAADDRAADYSFTIIDGTGEAMDRGEEVEILPAELSVEVGQVLEIVNQDDRGHLVGPFFVGAGETLRQQFASPGTFQGICTVHPSGQFTLTVT